MTDLKELYDAIVNGDAKSAASITKEALSAGADPAELVAK